MYIETIETNKKNWNHNLKNIPNDRIQIMIEEKEKEIENFMSSSYLKKKSILNYPKYFRNELAMLDYLTHQLNQLNLLKIQNIKTLRIGSSF